MLEFRIFRIPVRVEWSFWLVMLLFGYLFTSVSPDLTNPQMQFLGVGLFALMAFVSVLVHELGHAWVGRWLGGGNPHIVLHSFGGYAMFPWGELSRWRHVWMVAAGPGFQLVLGFVSLLVYLFLPGDFPPVLKYAIGSLAFISILWPIFNLLPVLPMDGGQIMAGFMGPGKRVLAHQISLGIALTAAVVMLIFGIFVGAFFMGYMAWQNWQQVQGGRF